MKLSKRLTQIEALITADYSHIWDTCCDHGHLGSSLISHQKAPNIHLVDIVPELITSLNEKLTRLFANPYSTTQSTIQTTPQSAAQTHWQTHCLDISELPLQQYRGKHLIIIAGIGGDLMIQCMRRIISEHPTLEIDFILCPVRHLHTLRHQLIELNMTLEKEVLVKENKIFYEILMLSTTSLPKDQTTQLNPVSPIGEAIWQGKTAEEKSEAQEYLDIKIQHYLKMQRGLDNPSVNKIIQAYQDINIETAIN
ncbi:MAG: tRNA (adenine(22)-N(1))-methyltransferase TrmK [Oleispira sp.]